LERVCVLYAEESASDLVKQLHSKTKDVFIKEAGKNVSQWWNQSGQSGEAAKIQKEWKDNNTNKKFGAPDSTQEGPATKRQTEVGPDTAPAGIGGASERFSSLVMPKEEENTTHTHATRHQARCMHHTLASVELVVALLLAKPPTWLLDFNIKPRGRSAVRNPNAVRVGRYFALLAY
jgi:hypothetical protein